MKSNLKQFIGRKVNVKVTEHKWEDIVSKTVSVDDPEFKKDVEAAFPGAKIRYKTSGYMYTQDVQMSRVNVRVNDDGIVTEVYYG